MTRFVPVTVLVVLAASRVASADKGALPGEATITFDKLYLHEDGNTKFEEPKVLPDSLWKYFNLAHCQCGKAQPDFVEAKFGYLLTLQNPNMATLDRELQIWVGSQCDVENAETRDQMCHQITSETIRAIADIGQANGATIEIPVFDLMNPMKGAMECIPSEQDAGLWAVAAIASGNTLDYFISKTIKTDSKAPQLPTEFRADGGDGAIQISWTAPLTTPDTYAYQALCARADNDMPGKTSGQPEQRYMTAQDLCGLDKSVDLGGGTALPPAEGELPVTLPDGLQNLDPSFLCGEAFNSAATGLRIEGLENGVPYKVVLLAVDKFQNASATFFTTTVTPVPSLDFWEDLHGRGSQVEGGLCMVNRAPGSGVLTSVLALMATAWWVRRRRIARRQSLGLSMRSTGLVAVIAVSVLGASHAHAGGYQPYWETNDDEDTRPVDDAGLVKWHAGLRFGPYYPEIDAQLGLGGTNPGPYQQMFHGYRILPMLDVDRILWTGFGQVGVGISLGYMQTSEKTFKINSDPTAPLERAGDENTFRLLPTAVTATYRFTWLDDAYGVPVVPYVRGGLSYYVWWVTTNGSLAKVCKDGGMEPDCSEDKALGASLGFQGSIGLAIRAERIDPSTAMSMQQSGILHAGIYGELSMAKVDGFGSATKLSVGDRTWFAGVNFEF